MKKLRLIKKNMKMSLFILLLNSFSSFGQHVIHHKDVTSLKKSYQTLAHRYNEYSIVEFDLKSLSSFAYANESFTLQAGGKSWLIKLEENNLFSSSYQSTRTTNAKILSTKIPPVVAYKGEVVGVDNSSVRLTIRDGYISGFIKDQNSKYFIEPLSLHQVEDSSNRFVVYDAKNVQGAIMEGALDHDFESSPEPVPSSVENVTNADDGYYLEIATEADEEYYEIHGENTNSDIISILNMSEEVYSSTFNVNFIISYQNVYISNDPYDIPPEDGGTFYDIFDVRDDFKEYWETNNQHIRRDVAALFSGRPLNYAGVAGGLGVVCNNPSQSYLVCKRTVNNQGDIATPENILAASVLFSHELGHCVYGFHSDSDGCGPDRQGSIMCGNIQYNVIEQYFSDASINRIENFLANNASCLGNRYLIDWTSDLNVTQSEKNKLTSTTNANWTAGAASINIIPADEDGWIETTAGSLTNGSMFGLSYQDTDARWNTIDFNFYMTEYGQGRIRIYNRSSYQGGYGTFDPDDLIRVERVGSTINYKLNNAIIYSQACDPTKSMIADISLYRSGHYVNNAYCSHPGIIKHPIVWAAQTNVTQSEENKLTSTTNANWTAGAASVNTIPANEDGWIETTAGSLTNGSMFGLSYQNTDARWNTIDFNFYMTEYGSGKIRIYNRSGYKGEHGTFQPDDLIRVERVGDTINYKLNNAIIYSQACDPTKSMIADISLYRSGHYVNNAYCSHTAGNTTTADKTALTGRKKIEKDTIKPLPNPFQSVFTVDLGSMPETGANVRVYSLRGTLIYEKLFDKGAEAQLSVDLGGQPYGLYILELIHDNKVATYKLMKK